MDISQSVKPESSELQLTHEFISIMLGARHAGVSEEASKLQDYGIDRYDHGNVSILDRRKLEGCSCECDMIVRKEFDCLLSSNGHTQ